MRILLFVADRPNLKRTARLTGTIARLTHSTVTLLSVSKAHEDPKVEERAIGRACEILDEVVTDVHHRPEGLRAALLAEARTQDYGLVVFGYRQVGGRNGVKASILAHDVLAETPVSVLVVKKVHPHLKRILICTSGSPIATPVVEHGAQLASLLGARATLLHVTGSVPSMYTGLGALEETLPELLDTDTPVARELRHEAQILAKYGLMARLELRRGAVSNEILREIRRGMHDLIVLGASRADRGLHPWLLGDITRQIVEQALPPVWVVNQTARGFEADEVEQEG